jgi:hypothetical protein
MKRRGDAWIENFSRGSGLMKINRKIFKFDEVWGG